MNLHERLTKNEIAKINLSTLSRLIIEDEFRGYFLSEPGLEHYKLLAYLSTQFEDCILLDIGTYKGCSSLALSYNTNNLVKSFDIRSGLRRISDSPNNIEYIIGNVIDATYLDLFKQCPLILLDTDHDGPFEHEFYSYLKSINWIGTLILDDINYNQPMKEFWNSITEEKYDISELGHHSGTGLVIFK